MGLFGFGRKHKDDQVHQDRDSPELESEDPKDQGRKADQEPRDQDDQARESDQVGKDESKAEQYQVHGLTSGERGVDHGPWDSEDEDVVDYDDYLDIGSLMLPFLQGSQLRLKANGSTGEVLGATITYGSSSLELEAFAAPKTLGLWDDVRADLLRANPRCQEVDGVFGQELALPVNVRGKDLMTRVVGIDGPRWMLRGIFSGPAAKGGKEKDLLDRYLADLVVVRGDEPLAPRDLIPMHSPVTPDERRADSGQGGDEGDKPKDTIPEKPEGPFDSDQQTEVKTTLSRGPMFSEVR